MASMHSRIVRYRATSRAPRTTVSAFIGWPFAAWRPRPYTADYCNIYRILRNKRYTHGDAVVQRMRQPAAADRLPVTAAAPGRRRWLLLIHQIPSHPSNLRVTTWRRLQQIGAIPLKQAAYALPDTPDAREDFEWLKTEVKAAGGEASVFAADNVDEWADDALVEEFRLTAGSCTTTEPGRRTGAEACVERAATQGYTRTGAPPPPRHLSGTSRRGREDRFLWQRRTRSCSHSAAPARGPNQRYRETAGTTRIRD